ncbi:hypothetical protein [Virgibacillus senegalensis]|uniref:hypothetical protein n=1 Tax=Virgibacillus senegalensis TaxID=1499679 RepID=UPI00069F4F2C|nr:hypothetical protein [Virgibacillus senegalensis]
MKQFFWIALLGLGLYYYLGEDGQEQQQEADKSEVALVEEVTSIDTRNEQKIADGVDKVLGVLEKLIAVTTNHPEQAGDINEQGQTLSNEWDKIEKSVEESFPEDYKNIEDSLYPLIAFAQKKAPDIEQIKQLSSEVKTKLKTFKQKLSS